MQRRLWAQRKQELEDRLATEAFLSQEDERQYCQLEDALDALDAELEFLAAERAECDRRVAELATAPLLLSPLLSVIQLLSSLALPATEACPFALVR